MAPMTGTRWAVAVLVAAAWASAANAETTPTENGQRYMVKFRDFSGAAGRVTAAGGRVARELAPQRVIAAYLPEPTLRGLQRNPNVEYVEIDPARYPSAQGTPYGISMVQADDPAFARSDASAAATVCIIDSGYHRAHEDLQDDYVTGTNDPGTGNWYEDGCGHGTHVAGTIAALNNGVGVVGVNGNGTLRLHVERVFGSFCNWTYSSELITALNRCQAAVAGTDQKLVVNMSLAGGGFSTTENDAFQAADSAGVLSIAATGNSGGTAISYPAGYASVVSVAAVDSSGTAASFSQRNADVELAAPGVAVTSTTPFQSSSLSSGGDKWLGSNLEGSARLDVSGTLANGGLCDNVGSWAGMVVLCQRGGATFQQVMTNVLQGGGVGAAVYNNVPGPFNGTLNGTASIPGISLSLEDGQAALTRVDGPASLVNAGGIGDGYEAYNGTSMATPHVAGVAALVWSLMPSKTNAEIRDALQQTVLDLGAPGRDPVYGYGLVRAKAAYDYLQAGGGVELAGLTLQSCVVAGCKSVTGTVTLSGPAPAMGKVVDLSDTIAAASGPATLAFPAGVSTKTFTVKTEPVALEQSGTVSATLDGVALSQPLTVRPMGLTSVTLTPTSVVGGVASTGKATLECKAGPGSIAVDLASSNAAVANPTVTSILIPAGTRSASFGVATSPVLTKTTASISGVANGIQKSKTLTVNVAATVSPASLKFGDVSTGQTSAPREVTLTNKGATPFSVNSIGVTGTSAAWFAQTNNCPASLAAGASCAIAVTFTPLAVAGKAAKLSVSTTATSTPLSVSLSGTGTQ